MIVEWFKFMGVWVGVFLLSIALWLVIAYSTAFIYGFLQ